ncbi:hypothetical protein OAX95_00805 [bacterium]|nr:hypothetical protein [bacterium]
MTATQRPPRIVGRWVGVYTAGLPDDVAAERRAELDSDIWEQLHDPDNATTISIISRLARGVSADLLWRIETRYHLGGLMQGTTIIATRIAAALVSLIAAFILLWGLTWTSPPILAVAVVFGAIAGGLWWASTTPEARERNRRLVVGGAFASVCTIVVAALVMTGTS